MDNMTLFPLAKSNSNLFFFQGAVRGVHDSLRKLRLQPGQPRPLREQRPVPGRAVGGAAEGAGSGAVVRRFPGGPGSHAFAETLLQVSRGSRGGHLVTQLCNVTRCAVGFRIVTDSLLYDN